MQIHPEHIHQFKATLVATELNHFQVILSGDDRITRISSYHIQRLQRIGWDDCYYVVKIGIKHSNLKKSGIEKLPEGLKVVNPSSGGVRAYVSVGVRIVP